QHKANTRFDSDAEFSQVTSELIGAPVEHAISHVHVVANDRHSIRPATSLLFEHFMDASVFCILPAGTIPFVDYLSPLVFCQYGRILNAFVWRSGKLS